MSIVSSSGLMSRFLPFSSHHQAEVARERVTVPQSTITSADTNAATEIAAIEFADAFSQFNLGALPQNTTNVSGTKGGHDTSMVPAFSMAGAAMAAVAIAFAEEATASTSAFDSSNDAAVNIAPKSSGAYGLKRTVSSLHFRGGLGMPASPSASSSRTSSIASSPADAQQLCSYSNQKNTCIVQAKQVEMEFVTLSGAQFQLIVVAPNGERSAKIAFESYGHTAMFSPRRAGCGHGNWRFEIRSAQVVNNKKVVKKWEESIYLDGVGSLFFSIDESLRVRLSSQEFLRLPSASRCCGNSAKRSQLAACTQPTL